MDLTIAQLIWSLMFWSHHQGTRNSSCFKMHHGRKINARIASTLEVTPLDGTVQQKTDRLMLMVLEAINTLTLKAKVSLYTKQWWTTDLTQLHYIYTYWRNRALDWPTVQSGPRLWVFWGLFLRLDHMVQSQVIFFRLDHLVQSHFYEKMGTISETGPYSLCQEWSSPDWTELRNTRLFLNL